MITLTCQGCRTALRTVGEEVEVRNLVGPECDWYPDEYPCPVCPGKMEYQTAITGSALAAMRVHDVTPQEAFAALSGLGLPAERDCGETAVLKAFERPIRSLGTRQLPGKNRTAIDWIEFEDGTRMFLASGIDGAVVYRIAPPRSFVQEVLREVGS